MSNKAKIQVSIVTWDSFELAGKLEDAIVKLQTLIKNNPNCFDFKIDIESESGYYSSCLTNINITAFRWETDEEFKERMINAKKRSEAEKIEAKRKVEANEKREKSLYESLKRKFEKEINDTNPK